MKNLIIFLLLATKLQLFAQSIAINDSISQKFYVGKTAGYSQPMWHSETRLALNTSHIFSIHGGPKSGAIIQFSFKNDSIQATYSNIDSAAKVVTIEVQKMLQWRLDEKQELIDSLEAVIDNLRKESSDWERLSDFRLNTIMGLMEKQRIADSLANNKCGLEPKECSGSVGSITRWKDVDLFTIGVTGDLRVRVLGQEICDPDGVLADYIEFGHKFRNMQFFTVNPKTGEQGYAEYDEIKKSGLLVRHYEYEECCYPFHRDSWIPASEIDNYCGYFWPGGPYVLIGSK